MSQKVRRGPSATSISVRRIPQQASGVCLAAALGLGTHPVMAQQAVGQQTTAQNNQPSGDGDASGALQEVIVTARFRSENLQSTPISITALSSEDLQQRQLVNVNDLGDSIP